MRKRITAIALFVLMAVSSLGLTAVPAFAAKAADFGMLVNKYTIHYYDDGAAMGFHFVLGAVKNYDITFSAALLDSAGGELATWEPITLGGGTAVYLTDTNGVPTDEFSGNYEGGDEWDFREFNLTDLSLLEPGMEYNFRLSGRCVLEDGSAKRIWWDYKFIHDPDVLYNSAENLGKGAAYEFLEFDFGDFIFNLDLAANEGYEVNYKVTVFNSAGDLIYKFSDHPVAGGTGVETVKYYSSGMMAWEPGAYTIRVDGLVDIGGVDNRTTWEFTQDVN